MKSCANRICSFMGSKMRHLPTICAAIDELIADPSQYSYVEPFLGSGVVFLNLAQRFKRYVLNDRQKELMLFFQNYEGVGQHIDERIAFERLNYGIESSKEAYYAFRKQFNENQEFGFTKAIDFIMLANTCINNIVRFNGSRLNSAYGVGKYSNKLGSIRNAVERCRQCRPVCLSHDFRDVLRICDGMLERGEKPFLFLDPPYYQRPMHCAWNEDDTKFLCEWLLGNDAKFVYFDMHDGNRYVQMLVDNGCRLRTSTKIGDMRPTSRPRMKHTEAIVCR